MELWLICSIISAILAWVASFSQKIAVEHKTDALFLIMAQAIVMMGLSFIYLLYTGWSFQIWGNATWILILLWILSGAQFFNTRVRAEVLKYLSSSEYFISFRLLSVIILTWFWFIMFHEAISLSQFIGLIIWSIGILLLFEEDTKLQHSRNWFRAMYLLGLSIILGAAIQISAKYITLESWEVILILFYEWLFLLILSFIFYREKLLSLSSRDFWWTPFNISMLFAISIYIAAITNFFAYYYDWPIGIVTKIMWYSVFIPIVFSIIFYKENLSKKKWIALILTIISIYYLS
jgi:drug/metabolite transporter (DMT)-like permease